MHSRQVPLQYALVHVSAAADVTLVSLDVTNTVNISHVSAQLAQVQKLSAANLTRVFGIGMFRSGRSRTFARSVRCVVVSAHCQFIAERHRTELTLDSRRQRLQADESIAT